MEISVTVQDLTSINSRLRLLNGAAQAIEGRGYLIGTDIAYGRYVTDGTQAHAIYPRTKKALWWPEAAHPVAMVNHPGTKPNDYLTQGMLAGANPATEVIVKALGVVISGDATGLEAGLKAAADVLLVSVVAAAPQKSGDLRRSLHTETV